MTFAGLASCRGAELERLLRAGKAPDPSALCDTQWRGWNASPLTEALRIRKFIKGFFGEPLEGCNIPARQDGWDAPWQAVGERFGFYTAAPVVAGARDSLYPDSLLLDYGASPRNAFYRVEKVLRDYVVAPDPGQPDLLLGKAYLAIGGLRVPAGYFILNRLR